MFVVLSLAHLAKPDFIECERFGNSIVADEWTCFMQAKTKITAEGCEMHDQHDKSNKTVESLEFMANKNVFFLPIHVYKVFPHLVDYGATNCSLGKISRNNFEKLSLLKFLYLRHNKITSIEDGTFADLRSLEILDLGWFVLKL